MRTRTKSEPAGYIPSHPAGQLHVESAIDPSARLNGRVVGVGRRQRRFGRAGGIGERAAASGDEEA